MASNPDFEPTENCRHACGGESECTETRAEVKRLRAGLEQARAVLVEMEALLAWTDMAMHGGPVGDFAESFDQVRTAVELWARAEASESSLASRTRELAEARALLKEADDALTWALDKSPEAAAGMVKESAAWRVRARALAAGSEEGGT